MPRARLAAVLVLSVLSGCATGRCDVASNPVICLSGKECTWDSAQQCNVCRCQSVNGTGPTASPLRGPGDPGRVSDPASVPIR